MEWVEPGTCCRVGVIRQGACERVDTVEPGACSGVDGAEPGVCDEVEGVEAGVCDEVEGVEPGVCCGELGGAGDVLLEGGIFNGFWFPSVSLKHKTSSSKPYCLLNHNAF